MPCSMLAAKKDAQVLCVFRGSLFVFRDTMNGLFNMTCSM